MYSLTLHEIGISASSSKFFDVQDKSLQYFEQIQAVKSFVGQWFLPAFVA